MRAQSLRHRVVFKRLVGPIADGQPPAQWIEVATRHASVHHLSGTATIKANAETSTVKASIRTRYYTDIHPGMRAHHGSKVYEIRAVVPDEVRRDHVDYVCDLID